VENLVTIMEFTQVFVNELDDTVEASYEFPAEEEMVVSRLVIELGDRVVMAKVMAK